MMGIKKWKKDLPPPPPHALCYQTQRAKARAGFLNKNTQMKASYPAVCGHFPSEVGKVK